MESQLQIYSSISIFGYVLAAVFLVASVAIFFLMDIKGVYAYLSGKKQQKGIMEMREKHQEGLQKNKPIPDLAKPTDAIPIKPESRKIGRKEQKAPDYTAEPLQKSQSDETIGLPDYVAKGNEAQTDVLNKVNSFSQNEHGSPIEYPTDVLNASNVNVGSFVLVKDVMVIHTSEIL